MIECEMLALPIWQLFFSQGTVRLPNVNIETQGSQNLDLMLPILEPFPNLANNFPTLKNRHPKIQN